MSEKEGHCRNWVFPEIKSSQTCRTRGAGEKMKDFMTALEAFGTEIIGGAAQAKLIRL